MHARQSVLTVLAYFYWTEIPGHTGMHPVLAPEVCALLNRTLESSLPDERGEGRLKAFLYLAFLIVGVFVAVKLVPTYVSDYQLKDKITETAKFAIVNRYTDEQIKDNIFHTIQDLDIPAKRDDIKVTNTNHGIAISVTYTVPVDFIFYKTDLNFDTSSEGRDYMK